MITRTQLLKNPGRISRMLEKKLGYTDQTLQAGVSPVKRKFKSVSKAKAIARTKNTSIAKARKVRATKPLSPIHPVNRKVVGRKFSATVAEGKRRKVPSSPTI